MCTCVCEYVRVWECILDSPQVLTMFSDVPLQDRLNCLRRVLVCGMGYGVWGMGYACMGYGIWGIVCGYMYIT